MSASAEAIEKRAKRSHGKPGRTHKKVNGKKIRCMCCDNEFYSDHKFNRLCDVCKRRDSGGMEW